MLGKARTLPSEAPRFQQPNDAPPGTAALQVERPCVPPASSRSVLGRGLARAASTVASENWRQPPRRGTLGSIIVSTVSTLRPQPPAVFHPPSGPSGPSGGAGKGGKVGKLGRVGRVGMRVVALDLQGSVAERS